MTVLKPLAKPAAASNSHGLAYDPKRDLLWAVNGYGSTRGVFVMKLDPAQAGR